MGSHAVLAPSSAPIWANCSGSVSASQGTPNNPTAATLEGEAAHWAVSSSLESWCDGNDVDTLTWVGHEAPNGVIVTDEMVQCAQVMVDDVLEAVGSSLAMFQLKVEHRVAMPQVHPDCWGTLDAALWCADAGHLYVWDYKHGFRENNAEGNWQLISYVAGLVNELGINGAQDEYVTVHMRIVQPRCYRRSGPVDEWVVKLSDLRGYFNQLSVKAHEALGQSPTLSPGLHCRDCPAIGKCSAARRSLGAFSDYANSAYELDAMTGSELAVEREILRDTVKVAQARLDAIEDDLRHRIQGGDGSTGLALASNPGRLKWTVDAPVALAFGEQFGADLSQIGVKTPTQAIKEVPAAMRAAFEQALKSITTRPAGELKLIQAEGTVASRAFSKE